MHKVYRFSHVMRMINDATLATGSLMRLGLSALCMVASVALSPAYADINVPNLSEIQGARMINYYRSDAGWMYFWTNWNQDRVAADLDKIKSLGFNSVRIFLQPDEFGFPDGRAEDLKKLKTLLTITRDKGLKVQLTLFDLWGAYDDIAGSEKWIDGIRSAFPNTNGILYIDLRNEVNLDQRGVKEWISKMLPYARKKFAGVPVTFSMVAGVTVPIDRRIVDAIGSKIEPDFWDVHFYMSPGALQGVIDAVRVNDPSHKRLFFGELGFSTTPKGSSSLSGDDCAAGEAEQASYFAKISEILGKNGLPAPGVWVFSDFDRNAIPSQLGVSKRPREYCFGLVSTTGRIKPAGQMMNNLFR
ncbi:cellulase family glycosylhydrolase [Paraburkholderia sp. GAS32]|uniref:cellulase family glycosylhydrolase n=1 Tax=Paraburkholderia sp. GAS32 TaxID=3035129 RepID=UPI003D1C851C